MLAVIEEKGVPFQEYHEWQKYVAELPVFNLRSLWHLGLLQNNPSQVQFPNRLDSAACCCALGSRRALFLESLLCRAPWGSCCQPFENAGFGSRALSQSFQIKWDKWDRVSSPHEYATIRGFQLLPYHLPLTSSLWGRWVISMDFIATLGGKRN